jgi:fused signal recognition particle receptor
VPYIFWIIAGGVVLALIAASAIVVYSNRRARSLPEIESGAVPQELDGPSPEHLEPAPSGGDVDSPPIQSDQEPTEPDLPPDEEPPASPEPTSRLARLRVKLASSNNALSRALGGLLGAGKISPETWSEFEATLISSDLGVGPTSALIEKLQTRLAAESLSQGDQAMQILREEMIALLDPAMDRDLNLSTAKPAVIMMVGVNGTGKTTTAGKLGKNIMESSKSVLFGAADTFRAAASEQLTTWGERIGAETVRGVEGADPASVAFDAVHRGQEADIDVVIVDTAGRLHNKSNLMDELGKVKRVIEKVAPVSEVLLVLDATTGQNGLTQARVFAEVVDITGIVLTKLDGSAKGGIVVAVQQELGVPVKYIGLGEGEDDLAEFSAELFVDGLLGL